MVDQLAFEAARRNRLTLQHARHDTECDGVLLTTAGREIALDAYERRMLHTTKGALPDFAGSFRRHLHRQAQTLAACVHDPPRTLVGLTWR
ncbi:hypothetical protein GCM10010492_66860 [Saccharothrix mutabilis subsp. mutabilis]|uniref:Uncharacterized protein n=1 Tax=Saccharothrix mutabilis subsp. mutabilis TaxID=66855 RepID=A0ABP3EC99_9PSEU